MKRLLRYGVAALLGSWGLGGDPAAATEPPRRVRTPPPMTFHLGRLPGSPPCGPACADFVIADGGIDPGAWTRFVVATEPLRGKRVPVLLNSPGGNIGGMRQLAHIWRERQLTIVVARGRVQPCELPGPRGCALEAADGGVAAYDISVEDSACASACPFAMLGAVARIVPPGARIGLHEPKLDAGEESVKLLKQRFPNIEATMAARFGPIFSQFAGRYGGSPELGARMMRTPHEGMDWLSAEDILRYRVATTGLAASGLPPALIAALTPKPRPRPATAGTGNRTAR